MLFTVASGILSTVAGALKLPVLIILVVFIVIDLILAGRLIAEYFTEHMHLKVCLPQLLDDLRKGDTPSEQCITESGLLKSQKAVLLEVTKHPEFTPNMLDSLAINLIESEQSRYAQIVKTTDLLAKLGPMFGLLGTLIPLGPGIIALGQGDTYTLSVSLKVAFDTTIAGLAVAVVAMLISGIRKTWYNKYMSILEAVMSCVVEGEKGK